MNTMTINPANVKPAHRTIFDARYLGKLKNRRFGQGILPTASKPVPVSEWPTEAESAEQWNVETYTVEEMTFALRHDLSLATAREMRLDFEDFQAEMDARDSETEQPIDWDNQEMDEARMLPATCSETDFARPSIRRKIETLHSRAVAARRTSLRASVA